MPGERGGLGRPDGGGRSWGGGLRRVGRRQDGTQNAEHSHDVADQLLSKGSARHPYLGVSLGRLTPDIQQRLGVRTDHGALVLGVDSSGPAAGSGIRPGDVLVAFAGTEIRTVEDVLAALRRVDPGQKVPLTLVRGEARQEVEVTIGSRSG